MNEDVCVIGSGPSAMACAHTLSQSGTQITILDVGMELDDRSSRLLDQFRQDGDVSHFLSDIHRLRAEHTKLSAAQPDKHLFGSDHPYRTVPETEINSGADAVIRSSLGKGGLTAVWGGHRKHRGPQGHRGLADLVCRLGTALSSSERSDVGGVDAGRDARRVSD